MALDASSQIGVWDKLRWHDGASASEKRRQAAHGTPETKTWSVPHIVR